MGNWIDVNDRLPDKNCGVIVYDYVDVVSAHWDNDFKRFYIGCSYLGKVTYWQPLPEPPKVDVNG